MRIRRWLLGLTMLSAGLMAACGSSGGSNQSSVPAVQKTCRQVSAVLSDGPDPGADPVGYAFAQILPLRQIVTSNKPLEEAIDSLATAYQKFYDDNGVGQATQQVVSRAGDKLDALCPGALS